MGIEPEDRVKKTPPKTVYVIGAGASYEVNMPLGKTLTELIASSLDFKLEIETLLKLITSGIDLETTRRIPGGDIRVIEALRTALNQKVIDDIGPYLKASKLICDAMPQAPSIDNFIDVHRGNKQVELCGKLAIVTKILDAEEGSLLSHLDIHDFRVRERYKKIKDTWFSVFFGLLTENCTLSNLAQRLETIVLIIFNYDRCVEYFLYHALQNYYDADATSIAEILSHLIIYHPYGTVGSLPWQDKKATVEFGGSPDSEHLLELASQIRTFTEGTNATISDINEIRKTVMMANRIVFLGFAFHPMNLDLLMPLPYPKEIQGMQRHVIATTYGISSDDQSIIAQEIKRRMGAFTAIWPINNDDHYKGNELFYQYRRRLSHTMDLI